HQQIKHALADRNLTASGPSLAMRIKDQSPRPVDILNSDAKDLLRAQPGILDDDEDVLHWLFGHRQQLRFAFWIYSLLPADFFRQFESWCVNFSRNLAQPGARLCFRYVARGLVAHK